jgi:quercetin dioxygenase-like cupin family protein
MTTTPVPQSIVQTGVWAALPVAEGATTSRVLVNNGAVRVVEFVMAAGQELTDHQSPRAVVLQVGAGDARVSLDDVEHDVVAGDTVYLAPGQRHAVLATTALRFTLVMTDPPTS